MASGPVGRRGGACSGHGWPGPGCRAVVWAGRPQRRVSGRQQSPGPGVARTGRARCAHTLFIVMPNPQPTGTSSSRGVCGYASAVNPDTRPADSASLVRSRRHARHSAGVHQPRRAHRKGRLGGLVLAASGLLPGNELVEAAQHRASKRRRRRRKDLGNGLLRNVAFNVVASSNTDRWFGVSWQGCFWSDIPQRTLWPPRRLQQAVGAGGLSRQLFRG